MDTVIVVGAEPSRGLAEINNVFTPTSAGSSEKKSTSHPVIVTSYSYLLCTVYAYCVNTSCKLTVVIILIPVETIYFRGLITIVVAGNKMTGAVAFTIGAGVPSSATPQSIKLGADFCIITVSPTRLN